ncbi:hypothetical protein [Rhodococcus sp. IEGM 1408]|uniref:hypothetical protein n=1 Tax=Rhodococcus sp. IEGM 1408 TaxID=3082220 RepID=UPI0029550196|nr:hypothetical protein [Rhodococcus sp. IEGM 1408]MDV8001383.1 hypothetical protein [Rhodococcus sp. IEGM 1408]
MTARSEVIGSLELFRERQSDSARKRALVMARPLGEDRFANAGRLVGTVDTQSLIVAASTKWTTHDESQPEDYRWNGTVKLLEAVALAIIGTLLAIWLVGLVV